MLHLWMLWIHVVAYDGSTRRLLEDAAWHCIPIIGIMNWLALAAGVANSYFVYEPYLATRSWSRRPNTIHGVSGRI